MNPASWAMTGSTIVRCGPGSPARPRRRSSCLTSTDRRDRAMVTREEAARLLVSQASHFRLAEVEVSGIPMRVYLNAPRSLRSLPESTASFGEREFLVYESERWTYAERDRQGPETPAAGPVRWRPGPLANVVTSVSARRACGVWLLIASSFAAAHISAHLPPAQQHSVRCKTRFPLGRRRPPTRSRPPDADRPAL